MAFPLNPNNGDTYRRFGRNFVYSTGKGWKPVTLDTATTLTQTSINTFNDIDITTSAPTDGQLLVWDSDGGKFIPGDTGSGTTIYATASLLPLSGNTAGDQAFVTATNRLYIWNGSGWYNIALINTAPTITSGGDASYDFEIDGTPIVITLEASDPEDVPITWSYAVTSGSLGNTATVSQADNVFTITPSTNSNDRGEFSITFTASDGVNIATSVSAFTLAFGVADQHYNKNSLLLKSGSTAGLNNTTFVDGSTNDFTVTPTGDVYQGSLSPYSPAGWSAYFDGTGDYLDIPGNAAAFGTSDYTVEGWHYYTGAAATNTRFLIDCRFGGSNSLLLFFENAIYKLYINGGHVANGGTLVKDAWQHFALVRSSGSTKLYVNGTSVFTWADSTNYVSTQVRLGRNKDDTDSLSWVGYMSDIRIVKGTAVYTSNFTPPTEPLTAISGTSLLTCQSNRFIDNSTNNFAITRYGDMKAVPFSPYLPSEKYNPTIHGGSAYFDGLSTTKLVVGSNSNISIATNQDFTLEFWVKLEGAQKKTCIFDWGIHDNSGSIAMFCQASGDWFVGNQLQGTYGTAAGLLWDNEWHHFAISRISNVAKIFIDGSLNFTKASYPDAIAASVPELELGALKGYAGYNIKGYIGDFRIVKGTGLYSAAFTPPTQSLTAISGTSLLLNMSNAGIYDEISKNNIKTVSNTTTSTTQTKYSDTAMYFDGSGDGLLAQSSPTLSMGNVNFTIEFWYYPTSTAGTNPAIMCNSDGTPAFASGLWALHAPHSFHANKYSLWVASYATNQALLVSSSNIATNTWSFISITRSGNTWRMFVNGIIEATATHAGVLDNGGGYPLYIGYQPNAEAGRYITGYIQDLRITKDVARYTANFTPPTASLGFNNAE